MKNIYFPDNFPYNDLKNLGYKKEGFTIRAVKIKSISNNLLSSGKWRRKGKKTYCGQFTSDVMLKFGCDIQKMTNNHNYININTTMSYYNCINNKVYEVSAEMAFYCARFGIPVKVLSPGDMIVNGKRYNHSVLIYPEFWTKYSETIGPPIIQEGWKGFQGYISNPYAYGEAWKNPMIKYFIFPFKGEQNG